MRKRFAIVAAAERPKREASGVVLILLVSEATYCSERSKDIMESVTEMSIEDLGEWLKNEKFSDNTIQTFKGESTNIKARN